MLLHRLALFLSLIFLVLIVAIRAQPEAHPDLEALLVPPEDCAMPCFLGIEMGETHLSEAVAILEAHPWVGDVNADGVGERQVSTVRFSWSEAAPPFLFGFQDNSLELNYATETVSSITLHFLASTGDTWRVLNENHTADGLPLSEYIRVDGTNCIYDVMAFYDAAPQRVYYRLNPDEHPIPYIPLAERPSALRCEN